MKDDASAPLYFAKAPSRRQVDCDPTPWAQYQTPLREAIAGGHLAVVQYLVEKHKLDLHVGRPDSGSLPHNYAASLGQLEIVQYLVECGRGLCVRHGSSAAWKERNNDPATDSFVLRSACESGNVELVKFVLSQECEVNMPDPVNGGTPLECACASGNLEIVKIVHEAGADINVCRTCDCCLDWTPMHEATAAGAPQIVDYLVRAGSSQINVQCSGKDRITPLDLAFESDQLDCAKVLFCHGAVLYCNRAQHDLRQQFIRYAFGYRNGWTNLQLCADLRMPKLAQWLLSTGRADPAASAQGSPAPHVLTTCTSRFDGAAAMGFAARQIFKLAARPWRPPTHSLYGPGYRRTVATLMLVHAAHERRSALNATLPLEMWFKIASMMRRSDHDSVESLRRVSFGVDVNANDLQVLVANIGDVLAAIP